MGIYVISDVCASYDSILNMGELNGISAHAHSCCVYDLGLCFVKLVHKSVWLPSLKSYMT